MASTISPNPPQKFLDIKAKLDALPGTYVPISDYVKELSTKEKTDFTKFYAKSLRDKQRKMFQSQKSQAAPTSAEFSKSLLAVDFTSKSSVSGFLTLAHPFQFTPPPQPIYIGTAAPCRYFLRSEGVILATEGPDSESESDTFIELRGTSSTVTLPPTIKYGICLGTLVWQLDPDPNEKAGLKAQQNFSPTPFRVWADVVTHTIWIVFERKQHDDFNGPVVLNADDPWSYMPSPQPTTQPCDAIQIMTFAELPNLKPGRPIFSPDVLKSARMVKLAPYGVTDDAVNAAIKQKQPPASSAASQAA